MTTTCLISLRLCLSQRSKNRSLVHSWPSTESRRSVERHALFTESKESCRSFKRSLHSTTRNSLKGPQSASVYSRKPVAKSLLKQLMTLLGLSFSIWMMIKIPSPQILRNIALSSFLENSAKSFQLLLSISSLILKSTISWSFKP